MEITQDWEKKFQIGTKQKRPPGHAGIGFLYKLIRFNRALLIKPIISHYGIYAMNQYIVLAGGKIKCRRCLATSTRTGQQCQRPALRLSKTQKCQFHGGRSTGSGAGGDHINPFNPYKIRPIVLLFLNVPTKIPAIIKVSFFGVLTWPHWSRAFERVFASYIPKDISSTTPLGDRCEPPRLLWRRVG